MVERASAGNLKATWVNHGQPVRWSDPVEGQGRELPPPRHAGEEYLGALRGVSTLVSSCFDGMVISLYMLGGCPSRLTTNLSSG